MRGFCEDACEILVNLIEMGKSQKVLLFSNGWKKNLYIDALNFLLTTKTESDLTMGLLSKVEMDSC